MDVSHVGWVLNPRVKLYPIPTRGLRTHPTVNLRRPSGRDDKSRVCYLGCGQRPLQEGGNPVAFRCRLGLCPLSEGLTLARISGFPPSRE